MAISQTLDAAFRSTTGERGYAEMGRNPAMTPRDSAGRAFTPAVEGSLANAPGRKIGRSMRDNPVRRLEIAERQAVSRGDYRAAAGMAANRAGLAEQGLDRAFRADQAAQSRDFAQQQDKTAFAQAQQLRSMDQAWSLDAENRQNARRDTEWQRNRDAEMQDRQNQGIDSAFTMTSPDGQFFVPMVKDKGGNARPMGGAFPMPKPGATPEQIQSMQQDAEKRGYDLMQMPSGEWKLNKRDTPPPSGWETTTTDAEGNTTRSTRKPLGGAGAAAGSRTSGLDIF
jgi:hypothetical protein